MKQKTLTIILGMIFLIGIVAAANTLSNLDVTINIPANVIAGDTFTADFSFDYYDNLENEDNSPLIIKLNLTSNDQIKYPVWKGDFEISGLIEKTAIWGIWTKTVPFSCSEEETQIIINPIDTTTINNISNGTFYCYNADGDLKLNEHDEVFLYVTSHPALYPSQYTLTAEMFYLNDTTAPIVLILNEEYFDQYFRDGSYVDFEASITDGRGIQNYNSYIETPLYNFSFAKELVSDSVYHFYQTLPGTIPEGDWVLNVTATDTSGNGASDNTIIKIDKTGPVITLVSPGDGEVVSEIIPLKINVTDGKSGTDQSSVYYRLREIVSGQICPEIGVPLGNYTCTRTDWINLPYILSTTELYGKDVNTTELNLTSGEYWLDVKAQDILGNENYL
ncbi:MAG: DUF4625 domain-containing protein [Nanoarchaeota archaeon]|nr:DUF4625 domain-containing protein [Nanoarchaeota archaeon]